MPPEVIAKSTDQIDLEVLDLVLVDTGVTSHAHAFIFFTLSKIRYGHGSELYYLPRWTESLRWPILGCGTFSARNGLKSWRQ